MCKVYTRVKVMANQDTRHPFARAAICMAVYVSVQKESGAGNTL